MKNYKDLEIFQLSYELALKVHELTMNLPKFELYEEGDQIRRSSKSITSNIVEGYGRRRYKDDFIKFLIYSHSSCDETILHLKFINDTHNNDTMNINDLINEYDLLGSKINTFIQHVEREWR
jgi:four helix bundle protein